MSAPQRKARRAAEAEQVAEDGKAQDAALIMPLAGAVLMGPLAALVSGSALTLLGAPAIVVYLFAVWVALVIGALALARRLSRIGEP